MSNEGFSRTVQLERMTSLEVQQAVWDSKGVVIIPVGAVEVHGPHLPVGTDTIETYEIGRRAAEKVGAVVTPPLWFGNSRSFMDFPGTISVRPEVLKELVHDVVMSVLHHGFNKFVVLDGHGGNYGILDLLAEEIHLETEAIICHVRAWELATLPKPNGTPNYDGHGGSSETSVMMALNPEDVDATKFFDSAPELDLTAHGAVFPSPSGKYSQGAVVFPLSMGEMVTAGHHGDPAYSSKERGELLLKVKVEALSDFLTSFKAGKITWRASFGEKTRD